VCAHRTLGLDQISDQIYLQMDQMDTHVCVHVHVHVRVHVHVHV